MKAFSLGVLLADEVALSAAEASVQITGLSSDARTLKPGEVFLAYVNELCDRRQYIEQAVQNGASAVIYEAQGVCSLPGLISVPTIPLLGLQERLGFLAMQYYGNAAQRLEIIGVTGTNGKTSCTHFIAQALASLYGPTAVLGTLGNGFLADLEPSLNTTPGAIELHYLCNRYANQGALAIAMEVSSHALMQGRLQEVAINTGVFTQLSRDHLDYHGTMEAYAAAKQRLFDLPSLKQAVFNVEDAYGSQWLSQYRGHMEVWATTLCGVTKVQDVPTVSLREHLLLPSGQAVIVDTPWGEKAFEMPLIGQFNVANVLTVIATCGALGFEGREIIPVVSRLNPVPGRMETFGGKGQPLVVVDYAHTPDALEKALSALRPYCQKRLICVFGCGGDRDRGKRPLMGSIAENHADVIVLTDDNPRYESPGHIIQDIKNGLSCPASAVVLHERFQAIAYALSIASVGDVILVAGKGHETYQIVADQRYESDDRLLVQKALST